MNWACLTWTWACSEMDLGIFCDRPGHVLPWTWASSNMDLGLFDMDLGSFMMDLGWFYHGPRLVSDGPGHDLSDLSLFYTSS